jgi:ATP-binding cassette, subfamily B, bacterial
MTVPFRYTDFALYRRLLRQARPYWPHIAGIFLLSLLSAPLALLTPLPLKIAVDSVVGSQPPPSLVKFLLPAAMRSPTGILVFAAGLLVTIRLLLYLQGLSSWVLQTYIGEKLVLSFRAKLFHHAQRLSLSYHDLKGTADSLYRIQYDARSVQYIAINGIIPFLTAVFTLAGMVYVTALIDWQLALIALAVSPILLVLTRASRSRLRGRWAKVKAVESYAISVVQEALTALRIVKAFGREDREQERFVEHSYKGTREQIRLAFIEGGFDLLSGLTIAIGTAAALVVGVFHVQAGALTLGGLLLVMAYLAQIYGPLETISKQVTKMQSSLASAERAFSLLDQTQDVVESPRARPLHRALGAVAFRKVSFAFRQDHLTLHDISFEIGPGARVGIVGKTGAGKTTLMSLLTRFYDPSAGQILLDGVDLRDYKLADLRNQFAIVLQEPVLFSTTIAENIAYARSDASLTEVIEAAKAANAHEFITDLPQGYETQVGERGMQLSGGERQRISLARAFLKDAPILILDEPTSSVDMKTEAAIMEAMEELMRGRTTFIIAHRLSTLKDCEVRLQLDHGRLINLESSAPIAVKHALSGSIR